MDRVSGALVLTTDHPAGGRVLVVFLDALDLLVLQVLLRRDVRPEGSLVATPPFGGCRFPPHQGQMTTFQLMAFVNGHQIQDFPKIMFSVKHISGISFFSAEVLTTLVG